MVRLIRMGRIWCAISHDMLLTIREHASAITLELDVFISRTILPAEQKYVVR